tara:strand:- start:6860 stop:8410 length:1551 start_codon:yes stop_codon:yes gene_type:complete
MVDHLKSITNKELNIEYKDILSTGNIGLEKESLRIFNSKISLLPHPKSLGSALCNQFITTDFSEAQPELITPPFANAKETLSFLEDIHHYCFYNIKDEILWPFSMPPLVDNHEIPIANYGSSNTGLFKHIYRKGLSNRYGRLMQTISGVHLNYSLPEDIWNTSFFIDESNNQKTIRSERYFGMLRNVLRMNWIILYLFGASPILTKNFILNTKEPFQKLNDSTFFLPFATSLRMSEFGYQNLSRVKHAVSPNSLDDYATDLLKATKTPNDEYSKIFDDQCDHEAQINSNILQIEDEHYAAVRAKSNIVSSDRPVSKLLKGGVNFLELRSLDLNPFSKIGIEEETILFLEIFLIYSFFKISEPISNQEREVIFNNDLNVAKYGRKRGLKLIKGGNKVSLRDWANEILDEMLPIAEILDSSNQGKYSKTLILMKSKIHHPSETLSGVLIEKILNNKESFTDLGNSIGETHKDYFLNLKQNKNPNWELFEKESRDSLIRQQALEEDKSSFESYRNSFLN